MVSSLGFFAEFQLCDVSLTPYNDAAFSGLILDVQPGLLPGSTMLVLALQTQVAWHPVSAVQSCGDAL